MISTPDVTRQWRVAFRVLAATAATTVVAAAIVAAAPAASAHTDLVLSNPSSGTVLNQAPDEVRLTFNEDMDPGLSFVSLGLPGEQAQPLPVVAGDTPGEVVATLSEVESPGAETGGTGELLYSVRYRVTSVDGHPVEGELTFTVVSQSPSPPPTPAENSGGITGPAPSESAAPGAASPGAAANETSSGDSPNANTDNVDDDEGSIGPGILVPLLIILFVVVMAIVVAVARVFRPDDNELGDGLEEREHDKEHEPGEPEQLEQLEQPSRPGRATGREGDPSSPRSPRSPRSPS